MNSFLKTPPWKILSFALITACAVLSINSARLISPRESANGSRKDEIIESRDLIENRRVWSEKKITNYDMVVSYLPHGTLLPASPVHIKVRNNKAVSILPISPDDRRTLVCYSIFETVEKMFDRMQEDLNAEAEIEGVFNQESGYPERIYTRAKRTNLLYRLSIDKLEIVD